MIDAYIIADLNNPVSQRYLDLSLESFKAVEDLIRITPVQCETPSTTPDRYPPKPADQIDYNVDPFYLAPGESLKGRFFGGSFDDNTIYQAIMYSQYKLIKRIADGEPIAIMEHDAAIVNEDSFRYMIDEYWGEVDVFMPGACMEFYGLSQRFAKQFIAVMDDFPSTDRRFTGPFGVMHVHTLDPNLFDQDYDYLVPMKCIEDRDKIGFGNTIAEVIEGMTFAEHDPATKQFMFRKSGNTNAMNYPEHTPIFDSMLEKYNSAINNTGGGYAWGRDFVFIEEE